MPSEPGPSQARIEALERLGGVVAVERVFGEPVTRGDRTIIPMAAVATAFGYGSGGSSAAEGADGGGGGGRLAAHHVGVIELNSDGVHIHPVVDVTRLVTLLLLVGSWNVFWIVRAIRTWQRR